MILKLDKGDTREIFKEFVDDATREYINSKIKSLFDARVDKIVQDKLESLDLDKMFKGQITKRLDEYFKMSRWSGKSDYVDKQIKKHLDEMDFKKLVTEEFVSKVSQDIFKRMKFSLK